MTHDAHSAWALFEAMRANPPATWDTRRVMDYEAIVTGLEHGYGVDLRSFRVPSEELTPRITSLRIGGRRQPGSVQYSAERYAESEDMKRRLDGLAAYFAALSRTDVPAQKKQMGFGRED